MVVSWPGGAEPDIELRSGFAHLTDIYETLLDAASLPVPRQVNGVEHQLLDGSSLAQTFKNASRKVHLTQYFEVVGGKCRKRS